MLNKLKRLKFFLFGVMDTVTYYKKCNDINKSVYSNAKSIYFVCKGNICRSPFAEKIAQKIALDNKMNIDIFSGGLALGQDEESPYEAIQAAKIYDIDLTKHSPVCISNESVKNSSIIIGMHYAHYEQFKQMFPMDLHKFYLLKHFVWPRYRLINIADPYNKPIKDFEYCYSVISVCVNDLIKNIKINSIR